MTTIPIETIKKLLKKYDIENIPTAIAQYKNDPRSGVKALLHQLEQKYAKYELELKRLKSMMIYEDKYYKNGIHYIAGIDEVGRGPLAGPVMAAAVILPKDCIILGINDSKKLSESKRLSLFQEIQEKAISIGIGMVDVETIDTINILQSTYKAMDQALHKLTITPQILLVDAVHIPTTPLPQEGITQGDSKSMSISAASIIAKVTRDRLMVQLDVLYPQYGFNKNKGYGTKEHIEAIQAYGLCPIHRKTFTSNFVAL